MQSPGGQPPEEAQMARGPGRATQTLNVRILIVGVAAAVATSAALAQAPTTQPAPSPALTPPVALAPPPPLPELLPGNWLRVTGEGVHLRSSPDLNSLIVTRLPRDAALKATGSRAGWWEVQAPPGVFSLVAAQYVERRPDGTGVVTVSSGTLRVRAASTHYESDPMMSDVQALLSPGERVWIVGERGEWLKIAPPAAARFFVHGDYASPVAADVGERLRAAYEATLPPTSMPASAPAGGSAADGDLQTPLGMQLLDIERRITAESQRPVLEQQWAALLAALRPLVAQQAEPRVAWLAEAWVARVNDQIQKQERLREARRLLAGYGGAAQLASDETLSPTSAPSRRGP